MGTRSAPQAFLSSYAPRLRTYNNALLTPVAHPTQAVGPQSRTTKRGTTVINYAEDGYDYDDDETDGDRRRPTGLRSLRREDSTSRLDASDKVGKDTIAPVDLQGIWRNWMLKSRTRSDLNAQAQAAMPVTLIPIRIDVDIPAFMPAAPFPLPPGRDPADTTDGSLPLPSRRDDSTIQAQGYLFDLDLPNQVPIANEISKQIRTQLEEYAGVALHPLFHSEDATAVANGNVAAAAAALRSVHDTPATPGTPLQQSSSSFVGGSNTPMLSAVDTPSKGPTASALQVTATASPIAADADDYSPDDTYRCIVSLSLNLSSSVYSDKFEWSLLHPPGTAEAFAKITCTDLGLAGEWVPALTHAIYEAVLRLKKEACESGGLVAGWGAMGAELPNDAAHGADAGWRYDPEHLAEDWEPKIEFLSKEEIEKREGDREREVRRLPPRNCAVQQQYRHAGRHAIGHRGSGRGANGTCPLGRSGTPGRGTPDVGGYGGGGSLSDQERFNWRCLHCRVWGTSVWAVRKGPFGDRTLCANCGSVWEQTKQLPRWSLNLHAMDPRPI
ncbi:uncharacterized protein PG986_011581 [Apiospora aurea]|uniref:GATA-type domain-containing protein n=1 Tax=Apiospora aurea TaxID=335848 RepID=A0ABR1PXI9_9PEZI